MDARGIAVESNKMAHASHLRIWQKWDGVYNRANIGTAEVRRVDWGRERRNA
jgi:hypothetical protein